MNIYLWDALGPYNALYTIWAMLFSNKLIQFFFFEEANLQGIVISSLRQNQACNCVFANRITLRDKEPV